MKRALAALALASAGVWPAVTLRAQAAPKELPPAGGTPKPFVLPAPQRYQLENGLRVTFVGYGAFPKAAVRLYVDSGNVYERASETWLADLTASLLREGTTERNATAISTEAARMGGSLDVSAGEDRTTISGEVLAEFTPDMIRLVAEVVSQPAFPASELPRLREDLVRRVSIQRSQPQVLAQEAFRKALYSDHAYGRLFPAPEQLKGYSVEQVKAFYEGTYGAVRGHLFVVGRFDSDAAAKAVKESFSAWRKGPTAVPPRPAPKASREIHLVDRPGSVQSSLLVGLPVVPPGHPDWIPLQVTNTLLGGYFSSRITRNLREDKGYTYSPFSQLSTRRQDAYWVQNADVTTAVTGASLKEIFGEIDRLQSTPPAPAELSAVQNYIGGTFVLQNSSRFGIIGQLANLELHGLGDDYLKTYVQKVGAVTPAQVSKMAEKYLKDETMAIALVGDRKVVEEQIKPFAPIR